MASVEYYVQPPQLYRYRSLANFANLEREIDAIREGYLHCATYRNLNDPMEGLFSSSQHLRKSSRYHEIRSAISNTKAEIGICSFTEVYDHELMWAHYADQFKGICVAYNFSRLLKNLGTDVSFVRMYYNEKVPKINYTKKTPSHLAKMILSYKNYR